MTPDRRNGLFLLASAASGACALHLAGRGVLALPDRWSIDGWGTALAERGALTVSLAAIRLLALGACAYLALLGALTVTLARTRHRGLRRLRIALTPRLLRPALGLVAVAALATPAHAAGTTSDPPVMVLVTTTSTPATMPPLGVPPTMPPLGVPPTVPPLGVPPTVPPLGVPPTMRRLPEPGTAAVPAVRTPPAVALPTAATPALPAAPPAPPTTWTVARGDHFWHIAERTRGAQLGRTPSERETATYWRALVAANRDRLVDPANPDLLFAGQELMLPPAG